MIHIRIDYSETNSRKKMACGISELPPGDVYFFEGEVAASLKSDCPGCNPGGPRQLGTPLSQLSGRPGQPGFDEFARISRSWGYE